MKKWMLFLPVVVCVVCTDLGHQKDWNNPLDSTGDNYYPPYLTVADTIKISKNDAISVRGSDAEDGYIVRYIWALDGKNFRDTTGSDSIKTSFSCAISSPGTRKSIKREIFDFFHIIGVLNYSF